MLADCSGEEKCQQWTAKIQSIGYDGESGCMAGPVRAPETAPAAQRVSCGADATVCRLDQLPRRRREGGCGSATPQTALSGPMTRRAVGLPDSADSGLGLAPPGLYTSMGLGAAVRTKESGGDGGIEQYIMARARSL